MIIAITSGEPAGIGPELCLQLLTIAPQYPNVRLVVLGDKALLQARASALDLSLTLRDFQKEHAPSSDALEVLHLPLAAPSVAGTLNLKNAPYVLALLDRAILGCISHEFSAMVTAPVHKGVINEAGIAFTGHTEYLAEKTDTAQVVMMLAGKHLRVALATTHLPLKDVPSAITRPSLTRTLEILHEDMKTKYGFEDPRILVTGLNPHAGEDGYLGREEIEVISPVLKTLRAKGMRLLGPYPADTLFTPPMLTQGDCVLAMYHDQGLTALKYATFGEGINVTLGLPIIRTSVDHGTALALAGTGGASSGSLFEAVAQAVLMAEKKSP